MDYLDWQSTLSAKDVFSSSDKFSYPQFLQDGSIVYLTSLSQDKNRSVLMRSIGDKNHLITPAPYYLQTQINEYGGKPFWLSDEYLIFANRDDQCLYRQSLKPILEGRASEPTRISRQDNKEVWRYTDVHLLSSTEILCICEKQCPDNHSDNQSFISVLNLPNEPTRIDQTLDMELEFSEPINVMDGADFYSNLVIDANAERVAWVQWNHPNMPWDNVELYIANMVRSAQGLGLKNVQRVDLSVIAGGDESVCQLMFADNGDLFFSADFAGQEPSSLKEDPSSPINKLSNRNISPLDYWQVYSRHNQTGEIRQVTSRHAEHGYPHWVYGDSRIAQVSNDCLLVIESRPQGDRLVAIDQNTLSTASVFDQGSTIEALSSNGNGTCLFVSTPQSSGPEMLCLDMSLFDRDSVEAFNFDLVQKIDVPQFDKSKAESISYKTRDASVSHGFFYPPCNKPFESKTSSSALPPLLVMVHGGPTARAYKHFDLQKQFWTNRGFAILDVNHRGSSGFGRSYRDALYRNWGELDVSDIVDGIDYLITQKKVDPNRVCIRGKSAGGYAVLRALTEHPEKFRAGANYYGIGNLVTLASSTHKFEKYYSDRLVGETFEGEGSITPSSLYYRRSPINKINNLSSAMIIFQGLLDKVVPPAVAQELVTVLEQQGQTYSYIEYSDEGHGFRKSENNVDAWNRELDFYKKVLVD